MAKKAYIWGFLLLTIIYIGLSVGLPSNPKTLEQYNITQARAHLLGLTIALPIAIVYITALYGFVRFRSYSMSIKHTNEGPAFNLLSRGLMILAFGLPISSIASVLLTYVTYNNPDLLPAATIVKNYTALVFPFMAILLVSLGAAKLVSTLRGKTMPIRQLPSLLTTVLLTSIFTWVVLARPDSHASGAPYFLPNWLLIATIIIPYVYIWCRGIMAAYSLYVYKSRVKGTLYRHAINYLARGVAAIIGFSIASQVITSMSVRLNRLQLTPLLLLIYVLIIFYAVGFAWVAQGAKKLKQIEEV